MMEMDRGERGRSYDGGAGVDGVGGFFMVLGPS